MYTKTIILMQDKRYEKFIKLMLKKKNRAVETDLTLLSDMDSVKNDIYKNRNTINIRGEFGHFVKQHGLPYMMIIDYMIDFGFPDFAGTDDRKLAQTFILSYTILAQAKGYDNGSANIVFIVNKKNESTIKQFAKYPLFLLDQIRTKDERVNSIIDSFAIDKERVKGFFKIAYILQPDDGKYADELERLERIMVVYDKIISSKPQIEAEETVEMVSDDAEPADVICRATIEKIITNGELKPISVDQKNQYVEKNVHLMGAVTMKTI